MSLFTFDWTQIAYIGSPLATPWWAEGNVAVGFVIFLWIVTPILYFTNVWDSAYMPVLSRATYNNKAGLFDVSRVLTDNRFDVEKYKAYSPLFLPTAFAISYALSFASVTGQSSLLFSDGGEVLIRTSSHDGARFPLLSQANPPSGSTLVGGAARHPCAAHVAIPPSPRLVVHLHIPDDVRLRGHRDRAVFDRDARMGICPRVSHRVRLHNSHRYHPGGHESADWAECYNGAHHRIFVARAAAGHDVVQDVGIHCTYSLQVGTYSSAHPHVPSLVCRRCHKVCSSRIQLILTVFNCNHI